MSQAREVQNFKPGLPEVEEKHSLLRPTKEITGRPPKEMVERIPLPEILGQTRIDETEGRVGALSEAEKSCYHASSKPRNQSSYLEKFPPQPEAIERNIHFWTAALARKGAVETSFFGKRVLVGVEVDILDEKGRLDLMSQVLPQTRRRYGGFTS